MKIKMNVTYGNEICEALKEAFGCATDAEFFVAFRAVMKASLAKEAVDPEDISMEFELID